MSSDGSTRATAGQRAGQLIVRRPFLIPYEQCERYDGEGGILCSGCSAGHSIRARARATRDRINELAAVGQVTPTITPARIYNSCNFIFRSGDRTRGLNKRALIFVAAAVSFYEWNNELQTKMTN